MSKTPTVNTILTTVGSVIVAVVLFWFFGGDSGVEKFLFTADVSDVTEDRNFFGRLNSLSFVLGRYPYSLEGIVGLYGKIAEENGWQINSGRDFNFNEKEHTIEAGKNGQHLLINLKRPGEWDKVLITITHDK
jgi:hypothetical protein